MFSVPVGLFASGAAAGGDVLSDLVAAWNFESDFSDQVGSNDLTNSGGVAIATGIVGNAASFGGFNGLSVGSTPEIQLGPIDFTISLIVQISASGSEGVLLGKWTNFFNPEYRLTLEPSDAIAFKCGNPGREIFSAATLSPDTPYLVIAKHNASASELVLRVVELGGGIDQTESLPVSTISAASTGALRIGWDGFTGLPSGSLIDAVHIWKRYLSAADEALLINGGAGAEFPFA